MIEMQSLACLLSLPLLLASCSDDAETKAGPGASGSGGSPSSTAPAGAVNLEIYATATQDCPAGNVHIDVGNTKVTPAEVVIDGEEGATVSCRVAPKGDAFEASAEIRQGAYYFQFGDLVAEGPSTIGNVRVEDPASGVAYATTDAPCVFQFAPGSGQEAAPGRIFVQFDCSKLVSEAEATKTCSARFGYVFVTNCEQ